MSNRVEFVSYDGEFPNLCSGTLVLRIDGETIQMPDYCMRSGGSVWFDDDWNEHVTSGEWSVEVPAWLESLQNEIERVVNDNVRCGCCGGCVQHKGDSKSYPFYFALDNVANNIAAPTDTNKYAINLIM